MSHERIHPYTDPRALHCFLDLETFSTRSNAVIASIGAVIVSLHDPEDPIKAMHYELIDNANMNTSGFHLDMNTVDWWMKQDGRALRQLTSPDLRDKRIPLEVALGNFAEFLMRYNSNPDAMFMWGRGSDFDPVILQNAAQKLDMNWVRQTWGAFNNRCHRTALENIQDANYVEDGEYWEAVKDIVFWGNEPTKHIALNDALMEALQILEPTYSNGGCNLDNAGALYKAVADTYNFEGIIR